MRSWPPRWRAVIGARPSRSPRRWTIRRRRQRRCHGAGSVGGGGDASCSLTLVRCARSIVQNLLDRDRSERRLWRSVEAMRPCHSVRASAVPALAPASDRAMLLLVPPSVSRSTAVVRCTILSSAMRSGRRRAVSAAVPSTPAARRGLAALHAAGRDDPPRMSRSSSQPAVWVRCGRRGAAADARAVLSFGGWPRRRMTRVARGPRTSVAGAGPSLGTWPTLHRRRHQTPTRSSSR